LKTLLFRSPTKVTNQMLPLWIISWIFILFAVLAFLLGWVEADFFKVSGVSAVLFSAVQGYVLTWAGDAARYLSPTPKNIKLRQAIRKDGIDLVKKIIATERYERIIIVGHSLGSVIGYDILKHLWQEHNKEYRQPRETVKKKTVEEINKLTKEKAQPALAQVEAFDDTRLRNHPEQLNEYFNAQKELWQEIRSMGSPWLITDFITLGSPLTHAGILLAKDNEDLQKRKEQRELPTNPPITEKDGKKDVFSYKSWEAYEFGRTKKEFKPWVIHHAGLFACTRWTNFYFPAKLGAFGDLVGGPLRPVFGHGIKDISVSTGKFIKDRSLAAHSSYWLKEAEIKPHLQLLIDALDLDNKEIFEF
jgi:hypothetical protein